MAETTLQDISNAASDHELLDRIISAAAEQGVVNPKGWAELNARRIVASPITEQGDTVASVYAYAKATYNPIPTPGSNPAAVTDIYLRAAVAGARETIEGVAPE